MQSVSADFQFAFYCSSTPANHSDHSDD